jgi:serine/threonine protein kinase
VNSDPLIGRELAGYRIEELIGRGGMGVVYRAEHVMLGRKDALKLLASDLTADQAFRERFLRESRLAAGLDHPNVIPIHHAGEADGLLYLAMRYVQGSDLRTLLEQRGRLDPEQTVAIVEQVSSALDAAHVRGLVHRDVKPANILIASNGHVYLTDFGIAKHTKTRGGLTKPGSFLGTLDYAAPEQIEGKQLDSRADIYALGCVVYQCLSGAMPYEKDSEVQLIYAHLLEKAPPVTSKHRSLPPGLDAVLDQALAKNRDERFQTCGELASALRAALSGDGAAPTRLAPHPTRLAARPHPEPRPAADEGRVATPTPAPPPSPPVPPAGTPPQPMPIPVGPPAKAVWRRIPVLAAAGAVLITGVIIAVVALAGGSSNSFPNAAETRLLALVPSSIRSSCVRLSSPASASAGVSCARTRPQRVAYYSFPRRSAMNRYYATKVPVTPGSDQGACGDLPRIGERPYSVGGKRAGRVFCTLDSSGQNAAIGWTDDRVRIFARAVRNDGRQSALYRWWTASAGPLESKSAGVPKRSSTLASGAILYRDTFSNPSSGWLRVNDAKRRMRYIGGSYRVLVRPAKEARGPTTAGLQPKLLFGDVGVSVDAGWISKPSVSSLGVVCSQNGDRFYRLEVFSNGLATISKSVGKKLTQVGRTNDLGRRVLRSTNHVEATCVAGRGSTIDLRLTVNGKSFRATDKKPLALTGAVGMIVSTGTKGGTEARFDNFTVRKR